MSVALSIEVKKVEHFNANIGLFKEWLYSQTDRFNSRRFIIVKSFVFGIKKLICRVLRIRH